MTQLIPWVTREWLCGMLGIYIRKGKHLEDREISHHMKNENGICVQWKNFSRWDNSGQSLGRASSNFHNRSADTFRRTCTSLSRKTWQKMIIIYIMSGYWASLSFLWSICYSCLIFSSGLLHLGVGCCPLVSALERCWRQIWGLLSNLYVNKFHAVVIHWSQNLWSRGGIILFLVVLPASPMNHIEQGYMSIFY